jgi:hypothetical protein
MKRLALVSMSALALAACHSNSDNPPPPVPVPVWAPWSIRYSPGMPTAPSPTATGFTFNFPTNTPGACPRPVPVVVPSNSDGNPCKQVDYVTRTAMPLSTSITIDYTITGTNPVWSYYTETGNTAGAPAELTLMIEHTGDDALVNPVYRWDSNIRTPIAPGHYHITVPLNFANWAAVAGTAPGTQAQFQDVLNNLYAVGMVFGGGDSAGHGLYLTSGSATFTLNSFTSP